VALALTALTLLGVIGHFVAGPQQAAYAPAGSQMSAGPQAQSDQAVVRAVKLYEPPL